MKLPPAVEAMASPLYTAPAPRPDSSAARIACVPFTVGDQPEMVPSSVEKMNAEVPVFPPLVTWKLPALPLKTTPVGAAVPVLPVGGGIVTVSGTLVPAPL